jgi:hypothetical protein
MDPWYFIDLQSNVKDENDNPIGLEEICEMSPDGSWELNVPENSGKIMFRDVGYTKIQYSNNTKTLYCHLDSVYYHYFNLIVE